MGRHSDPAAVTRRATVLTFVASALIVAAGIALFKVSGGTGWPDGTPTAPQSPHTGEHPAPGTTPPAPSATAPAPSATAPAPSESAPPSPTTTPAPAALATSGTADRAAGTPAPAARRVTTAAPASIRTGPTDARLVRQLVGFVNDERRKAGCRPLATNAALQRAAQAHSADMAALDYVSHISPDGRSVLARVRAAGFQGAAVAENLAAGQANARAVLKTWMDTPGDRAVVIDCRFTSIGVGHASGGSHGSYWTADFGA